MAKVNKSLHTKKKLIEALESSLGVVTEACQTAGVSRTIFYRYYNEDPEFKKQVDEMSEVALDFVESQHYKQIKQGNSSNIIFHLKTKGRKRGYVEKVGLEHSGGLNIAWEEIKTYEADEKTDSSP